MVTDQQQPEAAQSAFTAQGIGQPQPGMEAVQGALGTIQQMEGQLDQLNKLVQSLQPALRPKVAAAAQALLSLRDNLQQLAQRSGMAQGSPVIGQQQPQGNPAAGPPNPMAAGG